MVQWNFSSVEVLCFKWDFFRFGVLYCKPEVFIGFITTCVSETNIYSKKNLSRGVKAIVPL